MSSVDYWESMYERPLEELPWEMKEPPQELVEYFQHNPHSGEALDVGCGTGNFSFYLARLGFQVTGVDFSRKALAIGKKTGQALGLDVIFVEADVTRLRSALSGRTFDFILDYKVLHHLNDGIISGYARQFRHLLKPGGRLLLVCYADSDKPDQPFAVGDFGNTMFYRSAETIRQLYEGLKEIDYKEILVGKKLNHKAYYFVLEK